MNAEIGTTVYVVHVMDGDTQDVSDLKVEMLTKNDFFAFDPKTGITRFSFHLSTLETLIFPLKIFNISVSFNTFFT